MPRIYFSFFCYCFRGGKFKISFSSVYKSLIKYLMNVNHSHLRKIDWNTKKLSSKNTWSTWTRKSYGVQRYPAWVWVGPALGLSAKIFKIWSHGTKKFCSKISLHKVSKVPWRYFVGFEAKIVFQPKQVSIIQILDFTPSVGQKNEIDFVSSKSSLC